jgi:ABC-type transporter lipoprotein component MlaA
MRRRFRRSVALASLAALLGASGSLATDRDIPEGNGDLAPPAQGAPDPLFDEDFDEEYGFEDPFADADPFEGANRKVFGFNRGVDRFVLDPLTRGYQWLVPEPGRRAVFRAFQNLESPAILVNDLLQLRFVNAAQTTGRFLLNSTLGMGGLFDAGRAAGWERHSADFGQTLALAGVTRGPYIMIPVLGPSTVRDGFGRIVDNLLQPLTYILGPSQILIAATLSSGSGLAYREKYAEKLEAL